MLVTLDKRGSINLPVALRKDLGLKDGSHFNLEIVEGGAIVLQPVVIYPTLTLNQKGLAKLEEARESGTGKFPAWLVEDMKDAHTDTDEEVSKRP